MSAPPTRIDDEVYADAVVASEAMGRSTAKQLSHWARIGRELEATVVAATRRRRVQAVLAGAGSYDQLDDEEQALVRTVWSERIADLAGRLDVGAAKHAAGLPYVTVDADGAIVKVHFDGTTERV